MRIRQVESKDVRAVAWLEKENFSVPWGEEALQKEAENDDAVFLVAEYEAEIFGYCIFLTSFEDADLCRIAAGDRWKHQGVGSALLNDGLGECSARGVCRVLLEVRCSNDPAVALYEKHSFVKIGERKQYYTNPVEDALVMCRELPIISTIQK